MRFACWLALALVLCAAPAASAPPRLLLRADFDREPSCLSGQVGTQPGANGRGAALLLGAGAECTFPAAEHLDVRAGTLSFWARPHDWNDGEGRSQVLFDWSGQAEGRPFQMFLDSPAEAKVVRLVLAFGNSQDPRQQLFQIYAPASWEIGHWQKVDVTWDEHEIVLYANGSRGEKLALETVRLPDPAGSRLRLTPGPGPGIARDATAIDDLEIWDAALPADRIGKRFRAASAPPLASARLRVPHTAAAPTLDGRLDDAVWNSAVRVPLLVDAETGFTGLTPAHVALAWSGAALHLALEAPLTGEADGFEIMLAPASGGAARSFRVTTHGLAGEDAASTAGIEAGSSSDGDSFRAELSVPFAALRVEPSAGARLRLDLRHRPAAPGTLGVGARLADAALTLGDEAEGVRLSVGPELALGRLTLAVERRAGADALVELARPGRRAWRERLEVRGRRELTEALDPPDGVLRISVQDAKRRDLVQFESRLAPFETPGMLVVPEPEQRHLAVELDLGWLDGGWLQALASGRAHARLVDQGPQGAESRDLALDSGRARVNLAEGLATGPHRLTLELRSPSRALRLETSAAVPKLPWLGAKLGETEGVLDPWLPLGWDDDTRVRVSGRSYAFDGPLLAAVQGAGGPLLRGPMRLRLTSAAGTALFRTTATEVTGHSAARADFAGSGVFDGAGVDVSWSAWIEYDGAVLSSFTLKPRASGTRVEELVLEVPLEPRIARYLRGTRQGSTIRRGRVAWNGDLFESAFEPFVWLSNAEEGFLYFAESAANWVGAERGGAITVRGGPSAALLLRLIGAPVELPGPVTYTLGFQATPVKPVQAMARAWNFGAVEPLTPHQTAISWYEGYAVGDGVWELERPLTVIERDRELARHGVRPFYYATTSASPDNLPAFGLFEALWRSAWSYSYAGAAGADDGMRGPVPEHRLAAVCPADASFQQKMLYDADQLLRTGAIGLYTDADEVFADDNPRHGCGYHDAFGQRGVTWTILAKRRFAKRLAALLREAGGGRRFWLAHAHTRLVPPVHGFIDFWYPGEELTGAVSRNPWFYADGLDDDAWRVEYGSASSGIVHVFLPEVSRGSRDPKQLEARPPTESMLAMAAVNDVNVSSAYANVEAIGEYWGLRKKLGLIDAEFVGFWRPDCPVHVLAPDARASLYRTKQGPVLVVASRAAVAKRVDLQLDLGALGLTAGAQARDARSGAQLAIDGDRLSVPLSARSYTYVPLR